MAWKQASFKGKTIWAEVGEDGALKATGGRVAIRYSRAAGAKIYRAGASRVTVSEGPAVDLDAGVSADAKSGAKKKRGSGFGSAGTRTKAQAAMAAAAARELIASLSDDTVLAFTDGSCRGSPGPAGAGAWVRLPDGRVAEVSESLGRATNNVGELTAVGLVLDVLEAAEVDPTTAIALFSDSQYTNGVLTQNWKAKANRELILGLRERLKGWPNLAVHWIAGHVGVDGNERADALANAGVDGVSETRWS
jgi:ribonuclease HI